MLLLAFIPGIAFLVVFCYFAYPYASRDIYFHVKEARSRNYWKDLNPTILKEDLSYQEKIDAVNGIISYDIYVPFTKVDLLIILDFLKDKKLNATHVKIFRMLKDGSRQRLTKNDKYLILSRYSDIEDHYRDFLINLVYDDPHHGVYEKRENDNGLSLEERIGIARNTLAYHEGKPFSKADILYVLDLIKDSKELRDEHMQALRMLKENPRKKITKRDKFFIFARYKHLPPKDLDFLINLLYDEPRKKKVRKWLWF